MKLDRRTPRRAGVAMLLVLIAVAIATVLSLSFLNAQSTTLGITQNINRQITAREIAESALTMAINYIKSDPNWRTTQPNGVWVSAVPFAGGTVTISGEDGMVVAGTIVGDGSLADDASDPVTITARSSYAGVTHTVEAVVKSVPQNVQVVLMIVPNAVSLTAQDQTRQSLIESWGWVVSLLSENASQNDLDEAIDEATVVYISSKTTSASIANKLKDAEIGIVCEQGTFNDNLGMASADGVSFTGQDVNIVDNSHYITQTFSPGTVAISSSQPLYYVGGAVGAGATYLAKKTGAATGILTVIEANGLLRGSGSAAARRVFLPWGTASFEPAQLNANGRMILRRSLDWAAALEDTGSAPANRISVKQFITVSGNARIDSFVSSNGPYGGANIGAEAVVTTNSTVLGKITVGGSASIRGDAYIGANGNPLLAIVSSLLGSITGSKGTLATAVVFPNVKAPTTFVASVGDKTYSSGTTTISGDLHVRKLTLSNSAVLQISGNVVIVADGDVTIQDSSQIKLLPGASLVFYAKKNIKFTDNAQVNVNTALPSQLAFYLQGNKTIYIQDSAKMYASIVGPNRQLTLTGSAQLAGTFLGKQIAIDGSAKLSMDASNGADLSGGGGVAYTYQSYWVERKY